MSLTKQDLADIGNVIVDTVSPMFEEMGERMYRLETGLSQQGTVLNGHTKILNEHTKLLQEHGTIPQEHGVMLREHGNQLRQLTVKANTVDGKLDALQNDVKELYALTSKP